jgi:NAD(P)-dependent dehydrogenase (short-subunit alcohol dehydrogenase family)
VTVNAVCPGYTDTPMLEDAAQSVAMKTKSSATDVKKGFAAANPMGRLVEPGEVASLVAYLCSDAAAGITGAAMPIAGGEV